MVIYNKAVCFEDPENYEIVQLLIVLMQLNRQWRKHGKDWKSIPFAPGWFHICWCCILACCSYQASHDYSMAVLKKCESKDGRLDSDDDKCKDYIYIYFLKYIKVIVIIMMTVVSFDDCDDDDDDDDDFVIYLICFDAHYVCFADSSADTSQHPHEIIGNPQPIKSWGMTENCFESTEGATPPKLVSNKDPKRKKNMRNRRVATGGSSEVWSRLNNKQMWNRCELNDLHSYHATDWLGCHCTTCCTLNTCLVVGIYVCKVWLSAVADAVWCICVYPYPTHFLIHGGSLLLCKFHKLLTDGQGEFVS